ncbi:MAG TPA: hypothetical protein VGM56_33930 [Byssovorax sp.]|jgi:hypothetical protein
MSDDGKGDKPARDAIEGIGLLFRAGRGAAKRIKKNLEGTNVARSLDDAGRELARAVDNVVGRITGEKPAQRRPSDPPPPAVDPKDKPKGPTPSDPGFRIATPKDDDPS